MEAYFISDIHLKSVNERNGRTLLRFLNSLTNKADKADFHLFLLGDIFDLWLSDHEVFIKRYYPLIEPIKKLIDQGVHVYYFEGNHDFHIGPYWEKQLGVKVFQDSANFKLGPWSVRCEHGDLINLEDKAYLRMRKVFRHPVVEALGHTLPGEFWQGFGNIFSATSRKYSSKPRANRNAEVVEMIRHHAQRSYKEQPFDFIISGHMHVRDEFEFKTDGKAIKSINLGSWFEEPMVLKLTERGTEWIDP